MEKKEEKFTEFEEKKGLFEILKERGYIYQTTNEEEVKKLCNGKPMTIYLGIDPTADSLHIGHCFPLIILRYFQEAGHKIIILLGGATAMIGDPTGKRDMRKMVTSEFINSNLGEIKKIVGNFLQLEGDNPVTFVNNYDWFKDMNYVGFMREIGVHFNVNTMLATDAYKTRLEEGGLTFFEMGYMLMQAYDFVHLNEKYGCRMQMGGSDQWANILAGANLGRKLSIAQGKDAETFQAFTCPLLLNAEGKKMGKTEKGAIWVLKNKTSPYEFYQYFYNQSDESVEHLLKVLTRVPLNEIKLLMNGDIRQAKQRMAYELTKFVHGKEEADNALLTSQNLFANGGGEINNAPTLKIDKNSLKEKLLIDVAIDGKIFSSKSEARRIIEQGGLSLNGEKVNSFNQLLNEKDFDKGYALIKKGKKQFLKLILS